MTLIPMMSAALMPRAALAPAGSTLNRGSYNPGAQHHPLAAAFAVGLPVALVVAVALSPMISEIAPKSDPTEVVLIKVKPLPPPPPTPVDTAMPSPPTVLTIPDKAIIPIDLSPIKIDLPPVTDFVPTPRVETGPPAGLPQPPVAKPKFIEALVDPRYANAFQPDYPAREQRGGVEGVARVRVLIGADGRVKAIEDMSSTSPGFFAETKRQALSKWRFKPATRGGAPEESWKVMTVRFEIKGA